MQIHGTLVVVTIGSNLFSPAMQNCRAFQVAWAVIFEKLSSSPIKDFGYFGVISEGLYGNPSFTLFEISRNC